MQHAAGGQALDCQGLGGGTLGEAQRAHLEGVLGLAPWAVYLGLGGEAGLDDHGDGSQVASDLEASGDGPLVLEVVVVVEVQVVGAGAGLEVGDGAGDVSRLDGPILCHAGGDDLDGRRFADFLDARIGCSKVGRSALRGRQERVVLLANQSVYELGAVYVRPHQLLYAQTGRQSLLPGHGQAQLKPLP